ncbi:hypothetical protein PG994_002517 [Apiospora phragmitis]|uniref:C2H2-type domain-containing protein n=1 Tax=Apiospora phragmitis TaxID=2905665 RepID=A0ABR1W866_9PEZI
MEERLPLIKWSATFAVADPATATATAKNLPGDNIILPQSALEQLMAATTAASSEWESRPTPISRSRDNPYYEFEEIPVVGNQRVLGPFTFRLVNQANGNAVHAGVREFSAEEGEVALSPYLLDALGIDPKELSPAAAQDGTSAEDAVDLADEAKSSTTTTTTTRPQITIHAKQLPKGKYVRLRPLEAGYDPEDWKSLLERQLRESYTTLTKGALLSVKGVKGQTFQFLMDKFLPEGDGVCVVDTDLEVDIEALNEEQARETVRQIMAKSQRAPGTAAGSSQGREISIWKAAEGQVMPGDYVDYVLPSWDRSQPLQIEISGLPDDGDAVDLFVSTKAMRQRALPRDTEHVFGVFTATGNIKTLVIQPTNAEMDGVKQLQISVHGYSSSRSGSDSTAPAPTRFTLRAQSVAAESNTGKDDSAIQATAQAGGPDEEQCSNCHQWVPGRTMVLHESFCRRNNITCPQCGGVFKKDSGEWQHHWHCPHDDGHGSSEASKAKHDDVFHTDRQCPNCPFQTNSMPDLARHRTSTLLSGITAHEVADGARTADCHLCGKIVRLRDMGTHFKHHELDKAQRTKPPICRNPNCGRTLHGVGRGGAVSGTQMGQGPGNDLGLCSMCFAPLYVQLHDPEGKALRRRIERRYLSQLLQGQGSSTQAILPEIQPLMAAIPNSSEPMFFCVDETNCKRRDVAELLAAMGVWALEWCVAACEAEGVDPVMAREWLKNWAPTVSQASD